MTSVIPAWAGSTGKIGDTGGTALNPNVLQVASATANLQRVHISPPPAGTEWSLVLPTSGTWATGYRGQVVSCPNGIWARILSSRYTLTASASAGNRFSGYRIFDNGGKLLVYALSASGLAANGTCKHLLARTSGTTGPSGQTDGLRMTRLDVPGIIILQPGWTIGSFTSSTLQSGDQYSSIELLVEYWTSAPTYDGLGPSYS